ncbi:hypothetical protein GCM10028805_14590 [Spirosoma harenae]
MKLIPLFKCRNMAQAITFYTTVLDFELKYSQTSSDDWVVDLINGEIELQLTVLESDRLFGSIVNVWIENVDSQFQKYLKRGLVVTGKENSPVHQGPTDQSWGTPEFYITDSDGNTLRFVQPN